MNGMILFDACGGWGGDILTFEGDGLARSNDSQGNHAIHLIAQCLCSK
jgi:hypothetical protein